jgi:ribosome biogenesis GTPase A
VLRDHVKPLVLVLNKCDLVPGAAAAAWTAWFRSRFGPGLTVVPSTASWGSGELALPEP